ncbi:LamG-like jellyroll fold domain-containing protein [Streptomyces amritsarensis]
MRMVLRVAFGFAPTALSVDWTDITSYVDLSAGIRITRGASDELSQTQPSTMSLALDNLDGRFSAGLATSPYYPFVRPNCPIQYGIVTAEKNLIRIPSFETDPDTVWLPSSAGLTAWGQDATRAHSGSWSNLVEWVASGTGGGLQQTVHGLEIGKTYTLSGYVWVPTGDPSVRWRLVGGSAGTASATTNAWERISLSFTATSGTHIVELTTSVTSPVLGDKVWLDDVQVEEGASATTFDSAGAEVHWRFYGTVNDWGSSWRGLQSEVSLTATDLFKYLARLPQLSSLLTEEIQLADPTIYYPLTEPSTSASAGDLAGDGAGSLVPVQVGSGGTLTFGEQQGPAATAQTALKLAPAGAANGLRLDADMGATAETETTNDYITFECWFQTTVASRRLLAFRSQTSQHQLVFTLNGSGYLTIEHTNVGGTRTATVVTAVNLANGAWHHFVYDELTQVVYIDGGAPIAVSITLMIALRYCAIGGFPDQLWDGSVAHAAMYTGNFPPVLLAAHYAAGSTGFAGEGSEYRILRLAGYAGIAAVDPIGTFSPVASQGEGGSSALEMMRVVESTEGGRLASHRDGHAVLFQSRTVRYNAPVSVTLQYADLETDDVSVPVDDQKLVNQLKASRPGGATQRVVAQASVTAFGPYPKDVTILKTSDAEVIDAAWWSVSRYAVPQPELREVPVRAYSMPLATYRTLLDADISSVIEMTDMPDEAEAPTISATVEGYAEQIGQESHLITFHTSRTNTDAVWVLNDTTNSVLGSTTRLAY